jgi:outer membrane protein TolC
LSAPTIKQKQINADIKKANMDFNTKHTKDESKKLTLQSEHGQALRELNDAKRSLEAAIRQTAQQMEQLAKRGESLLLDAEKATDQRNAIQAHFNAGLVTAYELSQVALAITNAEIAVEKNKNQQWLLESAMAFPFLLG